MKILRLLFIFYSICDTMGDAGRHQALFIRDSHMPAVQNGVKGKVDRDDHVPNAMDQTVQNILHWLQGKYTPAANRKARQEVPSRQYLPAPTTTQRPRPFQPQPSYPSPPRPSYSSLSPRPSYQPSAPSSTPERPQQAYETPFTSDANGDSGNGYEFPGAAPQPTFNIPSPQPSAPAALSPPQPSFQSQIPQTTSGASGISVVSNDIGDNDLAHPPHVHEITVQCAKDMMTINIEFSRAFDGIIYSKGFYNRNECRYVPQNSGQTKYSITVMLNTCGTQFIDEFSQGKKAYLENVLVLQNEPGIQEVWDTIRSVRCLWEGNLNQALTVALSVGMLTQEVVTFSGDTANARLDIQIGKGPYAPTASGLVKIGELMTLVVTVEGDPGFEVLVRGCLAKDSNPSSGNVVQLTDDFGCVLKPKLMGAFQTTRNPNTNSVLAFAFFQAFKFPDVMDLMIECNIELCKTNCQPCANPNQKLDPGRKKRDLYGNTTGLTEPVTIGKRLRVYVPQDLEESSNNSPASLVSFGRNVDSDSVCLSFKTFLVSSAILVAMLMASSISTAALWLKAKHQSHLKANLH